jgi:hypothetical protein
MSKQSRWAGLVREFVGAAAVMANGVDGQQRGAGRWMCVVAMCGGLSRCVDVRFWAAKEACVCVYAFVRACVCLCLNAILNLAQVVERENGRSGGGRWAQNQLILTEGLVRKGNLSSFLPLVLVLVAMGVRQRRVGTVGRAGLACLDDCLLIAAVARWRSCGL